MLSNSLISNSARLKFVVSLFRDGMLFLTPRRGTAAGRIRNKVSVPKPMFDGNLKIIIRHLQQIQGMPSTSWDIFGFPLLF